MKRYMTALETCSSSPCTVRAYVALRTELFTNAVMYGRVIFPDSQKFVKNVRHAMNCWAMVKDTDQFTAQIKNAAVDYKTYEKLAEELEHQHSFVAAKLRNLSTELGKEKIYLDDLGRQLSVKALEDERKGKVLRSMSIASYITVALIPLGIAAYLEGKKVKERAHNQSVEADDLIDAIASITLLEQCCLEMQKVVQMLAKIIVFIETQITFVAGIIENAKAIQNEDKVVAMYLGWIKETAESVVLKLDPFIEGRVDYYATIDTLGTKQGLPNTMTSQWRVELARYMGKRKQDPVQIL
jgi:hypothetical protein